MSGNLRRYHVWVGDGDVSMTVHLPATGRDVSEMAVELKVPGGTYDINRHLMHRIGMAMAAQIGRERGAAVNFTCSDSRYNSWEYEPGCTIVWKLLDTLSDQDVSRLHELLGFAALEASTRYLS
jgi:hypothetical protein